jgi:hypothetical protein
LKGGLTPSAGVDTYSAKGEIAAGVTFIADQYGLMVLAKFDGYMPVTLFWLALEGHT